MQADTIEALEGRLFQMTEEQLQRVVSEHRYAIRASMPQVEERLHELRQERIKQKQRNKVERRLETLKRSWDLHYQHLVNIQQEALKLQEQHPDYVAVVTEQEPEPVAEFPRGS